MSTNANPITRLVVWISRAFVLAGALFFAVLLAWAFESRTMPDLHAWHTASLSAEFTAADATPDGELAGYLAREEQLFGQLHEQIYSQVEPTAGNAYSRYRSGGPQDPQDPLHAQRNWNRTFELVPPKIEGGALLLHGLTDSPYSVRRVAEILHAEGFYVLGLRLPGHGTIPAALTEVHHEDWVAASRMAARHVGERIGPSLPFVMGGYSNGGALTVRYSLDALSNPDLRVPDRAFLFSPEVGINALALISNSHKVLSFLPYFAKFKWLSIEPEYDPYKYNSFPKNAAQQAYDMTETIRTRIEAVRADGSFSNFPPVVTFLSWVDNTVETSATIANLYGQLENDDSELVIFDVNRSDRLAPLIGAANAAALHRLETRSDLPYRMTVIANAAPDSPKLAERSKPPRTETFATKPLPYSWPSEVYSLAHVAIPFPPDDPAYGNEEYRGDAYDGLPLGTLAPRGETGVLAAPVAQLMRLRHNPFFDYMERRIQSEIEELKSPARE